MGEEDEAVGRAESEAATLAPLTLLFIPPPTRMLLRCDHRHLKNNLMHGCSSLSPPPFPTQHAPSHSNVPVLFLCGTSPRAQRIETTGSAELWGASPITWALVSVPRGNATWTPTTTSRR